MRFVALGSAIVLWTIFLIFVTYTINVGELKPIAGAVLIHDAQLCETSTCMKNEHIQLPYFSQREADLYLEKKYIRATLKLEGQIKGIQALYFPKFSDNMDVYVNGRILHENTVPTRLWNTPLLVPVSDIFVQSDELQIDVVLYGLSNEGLSLRPFYFGPNTILAKFYGTRFFIGPELAKLSLGFMTILAVTFLFVWSFQREKQEYLWLGLSCATSCFFLIHYGLGVSIGSYKFWTMLRLLSISTYTLFALKALRCVLKTAPSRVEKLHAYLLLAAALVILLSPQADAFRYGLKVNQFMTVPSAIFMLTLLWSHQKRLSRPVFILFFLCLNANITLGGYEAMLNAGIAPNRTMHVLHLIPLPMSLACFWLIISQLISGLQNQELLTQSLNKKVAEKSEELKANFAKLTEIRNRESIAKERTRIMMDLHDGIGGQLVSTLAYIRSSKIEDEKVVTALEDALRDLALVLDSVENNENLTTLLGMLRTRLEGLLAKHKLNFNWQVHGEPQITHTSPSYNLHITRIVQEAITNVIKHAKADTITVFADESKIEISDNGCGFDTDGFLSKSLAVHGIESMKNRANEINVPLDITSNKTGTKITLRFSGVVAKNVLAKDI